MKGYTLIELFLVIVIIAITATFAMLNTAEWLRDANVKEARDMVVATLESVKLKSMTGLPHAILVSGGTNTLFTVNRLNDADGNFAKNDTETSSVVRTETLPRRVKITNSSGEELWFDRKGVPRRSTWGESGTTITIWHDTNNNNTPDAGEPTRYITISSHGRIQYER